jgi:hypothetical protein
MNGSSLKYVAAAASLAILLLLTACFAGKKQSVEKGATWQVAQITKLSELTIADGATVSAPSGYSLSMTVDGVETPISAGSYKGKIVLTPAKDIPIFFNSMGTKQTYLYRTAVYVDNGAYQSDDSVSSAVIKGKVGNTSAEDITIKSVGERFNGIMVNGNSTYTIKNPTIQLTGNGKNDFAGIGAAIRVGGKSNVTIDNPKIKDTGAVRTAIWVGGDSVATINNADIETYNGILPENYGFSWTKGVISNVMMEVPWMLGLKGNNRATLVAGNGTAIYNNSHIKAHGWGAMSTDDVKEAKLVLNKCHVETVDNGYGAYSVGDTMVQSSGTTYDVADYGLIMAGGSGIFTDGSVLNSNRIGVMAWGSNTGTLTIDKGTVFNTAKAAIQLKSATPKILVDGATLNSKSGMILEMMLNDDPHQQPSKETPGEKRESVTPPGKYNIPNTGNDEYATIKNSTLQGDFVNTLTSKSGMFLSFEDSNVTGAITTAKATHSTGPNGEKLVFQDSPVLYYLIGDQKETYAPTSDPHGATVSLDAKSHWTVTKTSYLTGLTLAPGATVSAPTGSSLKMTVNGATKPIAAGSYKGKIVLAVK